MPRSKKPSSKSAGSLQAIQGLPWLVRLRYSQVRMLVNTIGYTPTFPPP